jgi:hypothetical protein
VERAIEEAKRKSLGGPWVSAESRAAVLWPYRSSSGSLAMVAAIEEVKRQNLVGERRRI